MGKAVFVLDPLRHATPTTSAPTCKGRGFFFCDHRSRCCLPEKRLLYVVCGHVLPGIVPPGAWFDRIHPLFNALEHAMNAFARHTLIAVALLGLSCGAAVARTTAHATGISAQHASHATLLVKCKNPAECSVPR